MMWSYLVKGYFPEEEELQIPCKIDAKWATKTQLKMQKLVSLKRPHIKNYLAHN